jgi:glycosyltransferase involved in cell wall biosynthesis
MAHGKFLRIVLLTTGLQTGGAEIQTVALAEAFLKAGHTVYLVSLTGPTEVSVPQYPCFHLCELNALPRPGSLFKALLKLGQLLREWDVDVLHSHMVKANLFSRLVKAWGMCGFGGKVLRLVNTAHSIAEGGAVLMTAYRITNRLVDVMTHVSQEGAAHFLRLKAVSADRLQVMPNGIDTSRFSLSNLNSKAPRPLRVLHVGRMVPAKAQSVLLNAWAHLLKIWPDDEQQPELWMVGDGPLRSALTQLVSDLGLHAHVNMLGLRRDIPELLHQADIFVLSSDIEGSPLVLAEALACGVPVVATDASGVAELLAPASRSPVLAPWAVVCPRQSPIVLAESILKIAGHLKRDDIPRAALREMIEGNVSLQAVAERWLEIYGLEKNA